MLQPYKGLAIAGGVLAVLALVFVSGMRVESTRNKLAALETYKAAIEQRDALQVKLIASDLKLAETQRAAHEQRTIEVTKYDTKWLNAPAAAQQSCADSGLFELTDAVLGSLSRTDGSSK